MLVLGLPFAPSSAGGGLPEAARLRGIRGNGITSPASHSRTQTLVIKLLLPPPRKLPRLLC